MTPQEQQMIDGLVERVRNTPVEDKDLAAEQRLQQGLAGSPDALYVLAQTVLVQQYGLQQAQAQIRQLQEQLSAQQPQAAGGGSFLGRLFGGGPAQAPPYQPVNNPGYAGYGGPAGYPPAGGYGAPVGYAPAGGGFLRSALQTAAGVAAGEMAFAGMESLFHGFGGGYGGGFGGGYEGGRPEEVINNYYEDGDRGEHHEAHGDGGRDDSGREQGLHDADYVSEDTSSFDSGTDSGFDGGSDDSFGGDDGSSSF